MKSRIMIACLAASCAAACLALWSGDEGRLRALEVAKPPSHRPAARRNTPQTDAAYQVLSRDSEGMEQLQAAHDELDLREEAKGPRRWSGDGPPGGWAPLSLGPY